MVLYVMMLCVCPCDTLRQSYEITLLRPIPPSFHITRNLVGKRLIRLRVCEELLCVILKFNSVVYSSILYCRVAAEWLAFERKARENSSG